MIQIINMDRNKERRKNPSPAGNRFSFRTLSMSSIHKRTMAIRYMQGIITSKDIGRFSELKLSSNNPRRVPPAIRKRDDRLIKKFSKTLMAVVL